MDRHLAHILGVGVLLVSLASLKNASRAALKCLQNIITKQPSQVIIRPLLFSGFLFIGMVTLLENMNPSDNGTTNTALACSIVLAHSALERAHSKYHILNNSKLLVA